MKYPSLVSGSVFVLAALAAATAALSSCDPFNPAYQELQCGPDESCPGGMLCSRGVCVPKASQVCGDGLIVGKEVCDDGNLIDGDGCNATCAAATCYVPVTHPTVTSGLADQACSTVYVHTGMYAERLTLLRPTTLIGVGNLPPILDGGAGGTVVTVDTGVTATLRRLAISNGRATTGGGVLNRGTLTLDDVTVSDNTAAGEVPAGGGISSSGALTLTASTVARNHLLATGGPGVLTGAGIHGSGGTVRIDGGSKIEENDILLAGKASFTGRGAGVGATATAVIVTGASTIRGNVINLDGGAGIATANGGGVAITGGSLTVSNGSFIEDNAISTKGSGASGDPSAVAIGGGFHLTDAALTFDGATIRNNKATAQSDRSANATSGGGYVRSSTINVKSSAFTGNSVRAEGLAATSDLTIASVGGLTLQAATGTISDTSISTNTVVADSKSTAATPYVSASIGGAHIVQGGTVTMQRCTIDGNSATSPLSGAGASIGGLSAELYTGTVTMAVNLMACTISNNLAQSPTSASVGGLAAQAGTGDTTLNLTIVNSTISGNRADAPQGGSMIGAFQVETQTGSAKVNVILASSTITNNRSTGGTSFGGGLYLYKGISMANTTFRMRNSIVADNLAANAPDCSNNQAVLSSDGFNLFGNQGNCTLAGANGERTGAAALGPLADNGGPTLTHAPLAGSQAINNGAQFGCSNPLDSGAALTADQRGQARVAGGRCDIGAVEVQ